MISEENLQYIQRVVQPATDAIGEFVKVQHDVRRSATEGQVEQWLLVESRVCYPTNPVNFSEGRGVIPTLLQRITEMRDDADRAIVTLRGLLANNPCIAEVKRIAAAEHADRGKDEVAVLEQLLAAAKRRRNGVTDEGNQ